MIHKRRYGTFVGSLDGDTETPTHARDLTDLNSFQLWRGGGKSLVTLQVPLPPVGCGWSFGKVFLAPASAAEPTMDGCVNVVSHKLVKFSPETVRTRARNSGCDEVRTRLGVKNKFLDSLVRWITIEFEYSSPKSSKRLVFGTMQWR